MTTLALPSRRRLPKWGTALLLGLAAEVAYFVLTTRYFGSVANTLSVSEYFVPVGVLALGEAMVILTGNIDLSSGALASLSAVSAGVALSHGWSIALAVVLGLAVATAVGLINGLIVAFLGIDSLLVTLATQFIATSIATSVAGANPPYNFSKAFVDIGVGTVGIVPVALLLLLVVAVITIGLVEYTNLGRSLTLIGYSPAAARYTGITTRRALTSVFTLAGLYAGVAGVVMAAYYNSARPEQGAGLLLPAITAVVLGGVDIFGGRGRIGEVVIAIFLLGYLTKGMKIAGSSDLAATMVTGILLIAGLVIKVSLEHRSGESISALTRRLWKRRANNSARERSPA